MRKSIWMLGAAAWALSAAPVMAQQDTDQDDEAAQATDGSTAETGAVSEQGVTDQRESDSGDIIVTATRRNEALSDVPLAVSAVTAETLENSGTTDIRQLTQLSPSLLVSSTSSEAGAGVARIRGVGTVGDNPGLESSVAVFIDGVYRSRTGVALTELGQIERVEVLRGPQGTLFGRNASAGLLSIITARPRFEFGVNAQATYGNYDQVRGELGVTGPLAETIAFRVDGTYFNRDGFLRDVISGRRVNDRDRYLLRGQLLFEPTEQLQVRIIGDYADRNEECCGAPYLTARDYTAAGFQPSSIAGLQRAFGGIIRDDTFSRRISITPGIDFAQDVEDYGGSGEVVYDFGGAELTSITAYRVNDYLRGQDADFNNLDILRRLSDGGANQRFETFTQELRLQGELFEGKLDWLVGAYYADEDLTVRDNLQYGADYERFANALLFSSVLPAAVQATPGTTTGVNATVLGGAVAQLTAGIAQITAGIGQVNAGIAALSAIPPANRTPAQVAQLAGLQAQLATLTAQRATLQGQLAPLSALNTNPARPGFGSLAAVLGIPTSTLNLRGLRDVFRQNSRNFAFFTHNIIEITDALNLTLGARYTNERKTLDAVLTDDNQLCRAFTALPAADPRAGLAVFQQLACAIPSVPGGNLVLDERRTEDAISGTANLSWKPTPELLLYGSYSRGYKAGGFNLDRSALNRSTAANGAPGGVVNADASVLEFEPENVDAFELGAKYNGQGFDVNVSAFYQMFDDFQLNTFNGINFIVENINGCSAELGGADRDNNPATGACTGDVEAGVVSKGIEFETFLRPNPDLNFNLGVSYIDTEYADDLVGVNGRALTNALFQLPGRRISNSSQWTASGSASATPRIGDTGLSALFYVDARFQSRLNTGSDLDLEKLQEAVLTMNARLGLRGPDNRWGIEAFVQNLTGEDYLQVAFDAPIQGSGTIRGVNQGFYPRSTQLFGGFLAEPRTYGVTLRGRF